MDCGTRSITKAYRQSHQASTFSSFRLRWKYGASAPADLTVNLKDSVLLILSPSSSTSIPCGIRHSLSLTIMAHWKNCIQKLTSYSAKLRQEVSHESLGCGGCPIRWRG